MAQSVIELFIYATLKLSKVPEIADKQNIFYRKSYEIKGIYFKFDGV